MSKADLTLWAEWSRGRDAEAFAALVARHSGMVYGTCRRITGNTTDAEDVAQECFLALAHGDAQIRRSAAGWLHGLATCRSLNRLRGERRRQILEQRYADALPEGVETAWKDLEPHVDAALAELPEKLREAVVRHFLEGETHGDIATGLGLSRQAVSRRIAKGIEQLRKSLRRRGVLVQGAGLAELLASHAVEQAPSSLQAAVGKLAVSETVGVAARAATAQGAGWLALKTAAVLAVAAVVANAVWTSPSILSTAVAPAASAGHSTAADARETAPEPARETPTSPPSLAVVPAVAELRPPSAGIAIDAADFLAPLPSRGPGILAGTVRSERDEPVVGAAVLAEYWPGNALLVAPDQGLRFQTSTDEQGRFEFRNLPIGRYQLLAWTDTRGSYLMRIGLTKEEASRKKVEMKLTPAESIAGTVSDSEGRPVAGAMLLPMLPQENEGSPQELWAARVSSDEQGRFSLDHLTQGPWLVRAYHPDFIRVDTAQPFSVGRQDLTITLATGATVIAKVIDAGTGEPVPGIRMIATAQAATGEWRLALSDATGTLRFRGIDSGLYRLSLEDDFRVAANGVDTFLAYNLPSEGLRVAVSMGGSVTGRTYDASTNRPLAGVRVFATGPIPRKAVSDAAGQYRLTGLAAGSYTIQRRWFEGYLHGEKRENKTVSVALNQEVADIDFPMKKGLAIRGRVLDADGRPAEGAYVRSEEVSGNGEGDTTTTAADGTFALLGYSAGARANLHVSAPEGAATYESREPLVVGDRDLTGIEVHLENRASIAGLVVDPAGRGLAHVPVNLALVTDETRSPNAIIDTASDGSFRIASVEEGVYAIGLGLEPNVQWEAAQVTLRKGQTLAGLRLVLARPTPLTITGTVTNRQGEPLPAASVQAQPANEDGKAISGRTVGATTDAGGHFSLSCADAGSYRLWAAHEAYSRSPEAFATTGQDNVSFVLEGRGAVEGRVVDGRTGEPVREFQVSHSAGPAMDTPAPTTLDTGTSSGIAPSYGFGGGGGTSASPGGAMVWSGGTGYVSVTEPEGRFRFDGIEAGMGVVHVRAKGYSPAQQAVGPVRPDETLQGVTIRLEPGVIIKGRVSDETGQAIGEADVRLTSKSGAAETETIVTSIRADADGRFAFESLAPGAYTLTAWRADYAVTSVQVLPPSEGVATVVLTLDRGAIIEGVVRHGRQPPPGFGVHASVDRPEGLIRRSAMVDAEGRYRIAGMPPGVAAVDLVGAASAGRTSLLQHKSVSIEKTSVATVDFDVAGGDCVVEGTVTSDADESVPASMSMTPADDSVDGAPIYSTAVDASGSFRIDGLPAGDYWLEITMSSGSIGAVTRTESVHLAPGQTLRRDLDFRTRGAVSGTVEGLEPDTLASLTVVRGEVTVPPGRELSDVVPRDTVVASTPVRGSEDFRIPGLEPGTYTVMVLVGPGRPESLSERRRYTQQVIHVGDRPVELTLTLPGS